MKNKIVTFSKSLKMFTHSLPEWLNIGFIQGFNGYLLINAGSSADHASVIKTMIPSEVL